jgi:hypothetical protein
MQSNAHYETKVRISVAFSYDASETRMSIGSIASHLYQQYPISILGSTNPSSGAGLVSGPLQTSAPGAAAATPAGGLFDALMQALTQSGALTSTTAATSAAGTATTTSDAKATSAIGAGATSASDTASTSASGTETPQQAMQAFIQNLVSTLQSQGQTTATAAGTSSTTAAAATATASTTATSSTDPTSSSSTVSGTHGHRGHGGHGGHMSTALQDLIDQVDSAQSSTAGATAGATTSTSALAGTTTSSSALASLQQSFENLVSTMGGSSNASLSGFLTNFASDLSGMNAVGNLVNTQA